MTKQCRTFFAEFKLEAAGCAVHTSTSEESAYGWHHFPFQSMCSRLFKGAHLRQDGLPNAILLRNQGAVLGEKFSPVSLTGSPRRKGCASTIAQLTPDL